LCPTQSLGVFIKFPNFRRFAVVRILKHEMSLDFGAVGDLFYVNEDTVAKKGDHAAPRQAY